MIKRDINIYGETVMKIKGFGLTHLRTNFYVNLFISGSDIPLLSLYTSITQLELQDIRPELVDLTQQTLVTCREMLTFLVLGFQKSAFLHHELAESYT